MSRAKLTLEILHCISDDWYSNLTVFFLLSALTMSNAYVHSLQQAERWRLAFPDTYIRNLFWIAMHLGKENNLCRAQNKNHCTYA